MLVGRVLHCFQFPSSLLFLSRNRRYLINNYLYFADNSKETDCPWLSKNLKNRITVYSLIQNLHLPINSLDVRGNFVVCGCDNEAVYLISDSSSGWSPTRGARCVFLYWYRNEMIVSVCNNWQLAVHIAFSILKKEIVETFHCRCWIDYNEVNILWHRYLNYYLPIVLYLNFRANPYIKEIFYTGFTFPSI